MSVDKINITRLSDFLTVHMVSVIPFQFETPWLSYCQQIVRDYFIKARQQIFGSCLKQNYAIQNDKRA